MTYETLLAGIRRLTIKRAEAHGNDAEQARCNRLLDKLYACKTVMLEQMGRARALKK